jgi:hypothetical protein
MGRERSGDARAAGPHHVPGSVSSGTKQKGDAACAVIAPEAGDRGRRRLMLLFASLARCFFSSALNAM